jgi:heme exporter protein B
VALRAFRLILGRDLKLAYRRVSEWANPLLFFVAVSSLFPLALSPDRLLSDVDATAVFNLPTIGIGVLWMATLLSALMGLERLFLSDTEDGSMEQLVLSPAPLLGIVYGKLAAHWIVSALPLILLVPAVGVLYELPAAASLVLASALFLATPTLTVLVAIGAALTVNIRSAAAIIGLIVLPLCTPILIFGARATELAMDGESPTGPLYLLTSLAVLAVSLGPIAIAAAVRVGLE